jgi:nifR3 family TIM-barrel protein
MTTGLSERRGALVPARSDTSLQVGPITVATPVVLAPMAGVTNAAYRQLCREQGAGLYVCEMITSRGVVARDRKTLQMLQFDPGESVRSVQLYGVDPVIMAQATTILITQHGVGHVDLNFGCPVPKVTRKGGGAALPWKRDRLKMILDATVAAAARHAVPVTIKTRIGIDDQHRTFLDAGRIAEQSGVAAIALHGRTAQQAYSGEADWTAIAALKSHVTIPVLGNGDIWEASDALAMVEQTGVDGVVIGRGCLGRPWLFRDLADAFAGRATRTLPTLGEVAAMIRRHAELLVGLSEERYGLTELRKHMAWYLKGFPVGSDVRRSLGLVGSFADLDAGLARLDPDAPFPLGELGTPRGRQGSPRDKVALPEHWLDDTSGADLDMADAELGVSGG